VKRNFQVIFRRRTQVVPIEVVDSLALRIPLRQAHRDGLARETCCAVDHDHRERRQVIVIAIVGNVPKDLL
jgi:hypothetical protein